MKRFFAVLLTAVMLLSMVPASSMAAPQYAAVVGGWLRLRANASFEADTITSYYTDTVVEVLGTAGNWYRVRTPDGRIGYMYGDFLKVGVSAGTSGTENAFVTSHNGYGVRMRKGPGTGYRVIQTYAVGTPVTVLEQGTYWCRISINGVTGYMMSQFLNFGSANNGNGNNAPLCYATIWSSNGYGVRLRSGPSTSYGKIGVYSVGTTVAVLEKGTTWDRIRVGSRTGWMMNDFLIYQNANEVTGVSLNNLYPTVGSVMKVQAIYPSHAEVSYEWYVNTTLKGTSSTYTVAAEDAGQVIQLKVTGTGAYSGSAWSAQTAAVIGNTVVPEAKPQLTVGSIILPALEEGYAQPAATAVSITNSGNADAVMQSLTVQGGNSDCFTLNENGSSVVKAGETNTTWTVQPKTGLAAGNYSTTFVAVYDGGTASAAVSLTVAEKPEAPPTPTAEPTATPTAAPEAKALLTVNGLTLAEVVEDYEQPAPVAIGISNIGDADAVLQLLWIEGANRDCFVVNENGSSVIAAGTTDTSWTIQPKAGLTAGAYTATFVVRYDGGSVSSAVVNFTVKEKPADSTVPEATYAVTVVNGTADKASAKAGETVTVTANETDPNIKVFECWSGSEVAFADNAAAVTTFVMPAGNVTVTAQFRDVPPEPLYTITVVNGTADKASAKAGETVTVTANETNPNIKVFEGWSGSGVAFADNAAAVTTFVMPAGNVTVTAQFRDVPPEPLYTITVVNGTADKTSAKAGETVTVTANEPETGKVFDGWNSSDAAFADASAAATTFTMPESNVTVTAAYVDAAPPEEVKPKLTIKEIILPDVEEGYEQPAPYRVEITNIGNGDASLVMLYPESGNANVFTVNENGNTMVAAGSTNTSWTIQPNAGLSAGTYTTEFVAEYNGTEARANVSFTVKEKP